MGFLNEVLGEETKPKKVRFLDAVSEGSVIPRAATPEAAPRRPSVLSSILAGGRAGYEAVKPQKKSIKNIAGPAQVAAMKDIGVTLQDSFNRYVSVMNTAMDPNTNTADLAIKSGEAAMGTVNALFAPITAGLKAASSIPRIGHVADAMNIFFSSIGASASETTIQQGVDRLPVSDQTKAKIAPLAGEVASLLAQAAAGKAAGVSGKAAADYVAKLKAKSAEITKTINDDVAVQVKMASDGATTRIPIRTPNSKHREYAREQGYEPYLPVEELPIIKFGSKERVKEPVIQTRLRESSNLPKGMELVPERHFTPAVRGGFLERLQMPEAPLPRQTIPEPVVERPVPTTESSVPAPLEPVASTGDVRTSQLAANVDANAIEKKLISGASDLPEYRQANMAEQAQRAAQLLAQNPEQALRIAMGDEAAPIGLIPEAVFVAVENRAIRTADGATMRRLAQESTMSTQATAMGQRIRTLGERDQMSPVKVMADINEVRQKRFERQTGKKYAEEKRATIETIKKEMKKTQSKRQDWQQFMEQLTCGIE